MAEHYIRCSSFFLKNLFKGNALEVRIHVKLRILEFCTFSELREKILCMEIIYLTEILFIFQYQSVDATSGEHFWSGSYFTTLR